MRLVTQKSGGRVCANSAQHRSCCTLRGQRNRNSKCALVTFTYQGRATCECENLKRDIVSRSTPWVHSMTCCRWYGSSHVISFYCYTTAKSTTSYFIRVDGTPAARRSCAPCYTGRSEQKCGGCRTALPPAAAGLCVKMQSGASPSKTTDTSVSWPRYRKR